MIGSTIIAESDRSKLAGIKSPDDLDGLTKVELDRLSTIDFAMVITVADAKWTDGQPVYFNEKEGAALFKVSETGLKYVLDNVIAFPEEYQSDIQKLALFVKQHGLSFIYEYATF